MNSLQPNGSIAGHDFNGRLAFETLIRIIDPVATVVLVGKKRGQCTPDPKEMAHPSETSFGQRLTQTPASFQTNEFWNADAEHPRSFEVP